MSTTIDQRVVEMRFDNKHFESNVSTTMSTLDKLKQKLNFKGASKGLDDISNSAKKVDMTGLGKGVESVQAKFSALDVMAVTALANITNSAVNAGKRIASALTIDPIKTGLNEYEIKMNAIQVIQANTRGKNTMDDITAALGELNDYADRTIYNFAQMTDNVGKFVAQGLDVNEATKAVQGMANLAGASGASAQDMARATYQMSQALGGIIRKMDWNSLRNANMATQDLKNTLMDIAKVRGIDVEAMMKETDTGIFEDTLEKGWLTGELFTEAMNIYSDVYSEAELRAKGFNDAQIANFKDLANMAKSATTEVKTFTQLWDVLKETAQSGWTQTWELIFGDFETAKATFTQLQVYFSNILNAWSDARNTLLGGVLKPAETWNNIKKKLEGSGLGKIKEVAESVANVTHSLEYFQEVVNDVWRGDYKNSDTGRYGLLENAGYDHRVVQDLVNKGYQYKLTMEDVEASHKKFGLTMDKTTESTKDVAEAFAEVSDEQLRNAGLTEAEIRLYRQLEEESHKTGKTIQEIVDGMAKKDGRTMLIDSLKNAWSGLVTILSAVKDAWVDIFPPITVFQLYKGIEAINKFSEHLKVGDETADKLKRTFKGVFAVIDILTTILGGGFKIAFKAVTQLLGMFDLDILDVTANIGDAIVKFRDWMDSVLDFTKIFEKIVPWIAEVVNKIKKFFTTAYTPEIGENIVAGLVNGLRDGAIKAWNAAVEIAKSIIQAVKDVLGIHSPSTVFFEIGRNIIEGLLNGIRFGLDMIVNIAKWLGDTVVQLFTGGLEGLKTIGSGVKDVGTGIFDFVKSIFSKIGQFIGNMDFGTLIAGSLSGGMVFVLFKIAKATEAFINPLESLGDILENAADTVKAFTGVLKSFSMSIKAKALKDIAIALGILVAAVAVLAFMPAEGLDKAVEVVFTLAVILAGLSVVIGLFSKATGKMGDMITGLANIAKISGMIIAVSLSLVLMATMFRIAGGITPEGVTNAIKVVATFGVLVAALIVITKFFSSGDIGKVGKLVTKVSFALLLLVGVVKLAAGISEPEMMQAHKVISGLFTFIASITLIMGVVSMAGGAVGDVGNSIFKISMAMMLLIGVAKIAAGMTEPEITTASKVMLGLGTFSAALIVALGIFAKLAGGKTIEGVGKTLLGVGVSIFLLGSVAKMVSGMTEPEIATATKVLTGLGVMITVLIGVIGLFSKFSGDKSLKGVGSTLLMASIAIGILAGVAMILSLINVENLKKGVIAVSVLGVIMAGLIIATGFAKNAKDNLKAISIAIGVITVSVIALSMVDPTKLTGATAAMGILMGILALIVGLAGKATGSIAVLIVITAVVGLLGYILYQLAGLPVQSVVGSALALGGVLLAMSVALGVLALIGTIAAGGALVGVLALAAMMIPIGLIAFTLAKMDGLENALANAKALSILVLALSASMVLLAAGGTLWVGALAGMALLAAFVGELWLLIDPLCDIAAKLPGMGTSLSNFMTELQGFIDGAKQIDSSVADGIGALVDVILKLTAANILDAITSWLTGGTSIEDFGKDLTSLGSAMKGYSKEVEGLNVTAIKNSVTAAQSLADLAKALPTDGGILSVFKDDAVDLDDFGKMATKFAEAMVKFGKKAAEIKTGGMDTAISAAKKVVTLLKSMNGIDSDSADNFADAVNSLGKASIEKFVKAFSESTDKLENLGRNMVGSVIDGGETKKILFKVLGIETISQFINGILSAKERASRVMGSVLSSMLTTVSEYRTSFYNSGANMATGFANGISANSYKAAAKSRAMAAAAARAAKEELDEHSPSKVGFEIGDFFGIAFVKAIGNYAVKAYDAGAEVAESARTGLSNAIANVAALIDSDMDVQPTIRPVLDLSNVRAGANALGGMFDSPIATANVGAISTMMARRNQNGVNSDVVSAIDKLRKEMGNVAGNSYTINGITYDSGSEVSNAIETLVRAAKIERRV